MHTHYSKLILIGVILVYRFFGMGQTHFVFSHGRQLFWISVNTVMAMDFLKAYLDYLGKGFRTFSDGSLRNAAVRDVIAR